MTAIINLATALRSLKDEKEELEEKLKAVNLAIKDIAVYKLPKAMEDAEVEKMTISGVGTVYIKHVIYASLPEEHRDRAYEWLAENGHGALIKETVNANTLKAWAKEQLENNTPLPEFIKASFVNEATIRRS